MLSNFKSDEFVGIHWKFGDRLTQLKVNPSREDLDATIGDIHIKSEFDQFFDFNEYAFVDERTSFLGENFTDDVETLLYTLGSDDIVVKNEDALVDDAISTSGSDYTETENANSVDDTVSGCLRMLDTDVRVVPNEYTRICLSPLTDERCAKIVDSVRNDSKKPFRPTDEQVMGILNLFRQKNVMMKLKAICSGLKEVKNGSINKLRKVVVLNNNNGSVTLVVGTSNGYDSHEACAPEWMQPLINFKQFRSSKMDLKGTTFVKSKPRKADKRGTAPRPMNSFLLYRVPLQKALQLLKIAELIPDPSTCIEREDDLENYFVGKMREYQDLENAVKSQVLNGNHFLFIAPYMWKTEDKNVRNNFKMASITEDNHHKKAWKDYKFKRDPPKRFQRRSF